MSRRADNRIVTATNTDGGHTQYEIRDDGHGPWARRHYRKAVLYRGRTRRAHRDPVTGRYARAPKPVLRRDDAWTIAFIGLGYSGLLMACGARGALVAVVAPFLAVATVYVPRIRHRWPLAAQMLLAWALCGLLSAFLPWFFAALISALAVSAWGYGQICRDERVATRPADRDWGDGKDLSELLPDRPAVPEPSAEETALTAKIAELTTHVEAGIPWLDFDDGRVIPVEDVPALLAATRRELAVLRDPRKAAAEVIPAGEFLDTHRPWTPAVILAEGELNHRRAGRDFAEQYARARAEDAAWVREQADIPAPAPPTRTPDMIQADIHLAERDLRRGRLTATGYQVLLEDLYRELYAAYERPRG